MTTNSQTPRSIAIEDLPEMAIPGSDEEASTLASVLQAKLADAMTPGYHAELSPEEAEEAGAFVEDAITEDDAADSAAELLYANEG